MKLTQRSPRIKPPRLMVALVRRNFGSFKGVSSLLAVVTELELNSVIPPPDTIEEETEKRHS